MLHTAAHLHVREHAVDESESSEKGHGHQKKGGRRGAMGSADKRRPFEATETMHASMCANVLSQQCSACYYLRDEAMNGAPFDCLVVALLLHH